MMKNIYKIILFVAVIFAAQPVLAQNIGNLDGISYQAVAIDDQGKEIVGVDIEGNPVNEKSIDVRFTIQKGESGPIEYQEEHTTNTDESGLFSLTIGQGELTGLGEYSHLMDIPWIDADQWLKVEISIEDRGYRLVSLQKFMSVPYSFYTDDIADNAVTTAKILDESIINEDIADSTIDLTTKVQDTLAVVNGGTGLGVVEEGDILIGSGISAMDTLAVYDSAMLFSNKGGNTELYKLRSGARTNITVDETNKTITIEAIEQGGGPGTGIGDVAVPNIDPGKQVERNFPAAGVEPGDIILATINEDLKGLTVTAYVRQAGKVIVVFFNGSGQPVNLGPVTVNFANFGQP